MPVVQWLCLHCGQEQSFEEESPSSPRLCPRCLEPLQVKTQDSVQPPPGGLQQPPVIPEAKVAEGESIFADPGDEELFGETEPPKVEMPAPLDPSLAGTQLVADVHEPEEPIPQSDLPLLDPTPVPDTADLQFRPGGTVQPARPGESDLGTEISPEQLLAVAPRRAVTSRGHGGLFLVLVVIPLISYAILATIAIIILYLRSQASPSPFEYLPDPQGDFQGAKHQKHGSISYQRLQPDSELPAKLKVNLGQSITLGGVEVTPRKVELQPIKILSAGLPPVEPREPVLALYFKVRNISEDCVFCPTDPYFERRWKTDTAFGSKPYTFLEMGEQRFYGGPLSWQPGRQADERERVQGQEHRILNPGETVTTFVCTDPEDRVAEGLARYQGELLWRIQIRRGLVREGGREAPATAVVGVKFAAAEVHKS